MTVSDIPNSNQTNQGRNSEAINREVRQEPRQSTPISNRTERQNNNILLACSLLAGASVARNNTLIVNQQETQQRDYSTEFLPSIIQIFSSEPNIIAGGEQVIFDGTNVNTGISYRYLSGNEIEIISTGIYQITFVANISASDGTQTASFAIAVNGTANTISQINQTVVANQSYNVKTQLVFKVTETPTTISIFNNGTDAINVSNASLVINKISN